MRSDSQERRMAMIAHDQPYWAACARVAGMDEAGRGPLAGNVVTACVIMPSAPTVDWVDDSKKLSALRRDKVYEEILRTALYVGVGRASAQEIDEINILQATMNAMRRAAADAQANIYLIDAVKNLGLDAPEIPIVHGDAVSYSCLLYTSFYVTHRFFVSFLTQERNVPLVSPFPSFSSPIKNGPHEATRINET